MQMARPFAGDYVYYFYYYGTGSPAVRAPK
jgi:hypothetical protein